MTSCSAHFSEAVTYWFLWTNESTFLILFYYFYFVLWCRSANNAFAKLKPTSTITTKLTLFSEGDTWQFQELINQWPSESPQRTRVEIFHPTYFHFRPEMLRDGKQEVLEHHHHHVIFRSYETLEKPPFLLVHHSMFYHSSPCFIICPSKLHTVYSTPAYKTPVTHITHLKCLGTSGKSTTAI